MKFPIKFKTNFYSDDISGIEIQDFSMHIDQPIKHAVDKIDIIATKGARMTLFELYSIATAKKLKEYNLDEMNEYALASVLRKELLLSLEEASEKGHHVFTALIDKPKNWKQPSTTQNNDIFEEEMALLEKIPQKKALPKTADVIQSPKKVSNSIRKNNKQEVINMDIEDDIIQTDNGIAMEKYNGGVLNETVYKLNPKKGYKPKYQPVQSNVPTRNNNSGGVKTRSI